MQVKLVLTGLRRIEVQPSKVQEPVDGMTRLTVNYCGVCRTDAKMWHEGHRDLVFPRVPGHEVVVTDPAGLRYTIWPGMACGNCRYCKAGNENLCQHMAIMGFHFDGGFGDTVMAPTASLIPVPAGIPSPLVCFTEPVGCVLNALDKLNLQPMQRVVIYGGGTVGLIAALMVKERGCQVVVIEKNAKKIDQAEPFLDQTTLTCLRQTNDSDFDAAINACPDPIAFCQAASKLAKGGRLAFFSGLTKNKSIETNLLNLLHYKEVSIFGAYGLTRNHMSRALGVIARHPDAFDHLVESTISPRQLPNSLPLVLAGKAFKYILDFCSNRRDHPAPVLPQRANRQSEKMEADTSRAAQRLFHRIRHAVTPVSLNLMAAARQKMDNKTKPLGALGRLEELAIQMSLIQGSLDPQVNRKALFVFAGDHGVAEEGVSAYPSEVTRQMVANFLDGGAAINVLCRHQGIDMRIVDMGVNAELAPHADLVTKKIRPGTRNFALEAAMTMDEAIRALEAGMDCFLNAHTDDPIHVVGLGEMGIGNTTSASAIISAATGITPQQATGRGTGIDDAGVRHKVNVIRKVLDFHRPDPNDGLDILCKIGGFEIAGIAGAALAAASEGVAVVLDGVISTAAGLIAHLIQPAVSGYLISGHRSVEVAQLAALEKMKLVPVIDLDMRLGEGTGAALTIDIITVACRIMREMATFDDAGVSKRGDA